MEGVASTSELVDTEVKLCDEDVWEALAEVLMKTGELWLEKLSLDVERLLVDTLDDEVKLCEVEDVLEMGILELAKRG